MRKTVTICVPTFNSESTLGETLTSILNQTYRELSVQIFDNASTDKTIEIAMSFAKTDARIQVSAHPTNVGAEGNFNRCLAAAAGDFTAIFHADDVYEPEMVESQVRFLESKPDCVAVSTGASIIDGHGSKRGRRFLPDEVLRSEDASYAFDELFGLTLQYGNFITCPSVMARSHIYRDVIKTWDGKTFGSSADLDVWLRLAQAGRFGILKQSLMRYRVSEASFTVRETKRRFTEHDLLKVYRRYLAVSQTSSADSSSEKLRYLHFHEFKDAAARRLNILQTRQRDLEFPAFKESRLGLLPLALKSRYHFKFLAASYAIFFVTGAMKLAGLHK